MEQNNMPWPDLIISSRDSLGVQHGLERDAGYDPRSMVERGREDRCTHPSVFRVAHRNALKVVAHPRLAAKRQGNLKPYFRRVVGRHFANLSTLSIILPTFDAW